MKQVIILLNDEGDEFFWRFDTGTASDLKEHYDKMISDNENYCHVPDAMEVKEEALDCHSLVEQVADSIREQIEDKHNLIIRRR